MKPRDATTNKLQVDKMRLEEMAAVFHRDFDGPISQVCELLLVIPQQCGLDYGPGGGGGGPFFCHMYGRPREFITAQHFLAETLQDLKQAVDALNPRRIEKYISYGDGKNDRCLYKDGGTYIAWVEKKFLRLLKQNARRIADRHLTVKRLPEDMKKAIRVYGTLERKLINPWKTDNRLQELSQLLAVTSTLPPLNFPETTLAITKPNRPPRKMPGGAKRLEDFVTQLIGRQRRA